MSKQVMFNLQLPRDGTHVGIVEQAKGHGLPFSLEEANEIVSMCLKNPSFEPVMSYSIIFTQAERTNLLTISRRLYACARLLREGRGEMPREAIQEAEGLMHLFRGVAESFSSLLTAEKARRETP